MNKQSKHLMWLLMDFSIHRYLLSKTRGRINGYEKAERHIDLSAIFIASKRFCSIDRAKSDENLMLIHDATTKLTDHLDTEIGFPLDDVPEDYEGLSRKFFNKFLELAEEAWKKRE